MHKCQHCGQPVLKSDRKAELAEFEADGDLLDEVLDELPEAFAGHHAQKLTAKKPVAEVVEVKVDDQDDQDDQDDDELV